MQKIYTTSTSEQKKFEATYKPVRGRLEISLHTGKIIFRVGERVFNVLKQHKAQILFNTYGNLVDIELHQLKKLPSFVTPELFYEQYLHTQQPPQAHVPANNIVPFSNQRVAV